MLISKTATFERLRVARSGMAAQGCTGLRRAVQGCTGLYRAGQGCTGLYRAAWMLISKMATIEGLRVATAGFRVLLVDTRESGQA